MTRPTQTERRFAVCVGINNYAPNSGLSDLRFAEADARAMDAILGELGCAPSDRRLLLGAHATLEAITKALDESIIDLAGENDLVVFFFAGHGKPVSIGEGVKREPEVYLAPFDFDPKQARRLSFQRLYGLSMTRLRSTYFTGEGSRKRLFIFDSCYSGEFPGPGYRDDVDPVAGHIQQLLQTTATGRIALASCLPTQKAVEDPILGHGRLTYHLLKALRGEEPNAKHPDGAISVGSLFYYLSQALAPQCPVLSGVQHESFVLVSSASPPLTSQTAVAKKWPVITDGIDESGVRNNWINTPYPKITISDIRGKFKSMNDTEFTAFCQDHLPDIAVQMGDGQSLATKVNLVIDHCIRKSEVRQRVINLLFS